MAEPQHPATLVDWLDDLTVRFLLNLPASELSSVPRLCFQVEEAQWFYEDFVRPAVAASGAPPLPSLPLRQFCLLLFQHCPLLSGFTDAQHIAAYEEFLAYKVRVPVRGAILLDHDMEKVVLVRGWKKGASWSFPRGKINKDEKDLDCAIREVYEETGYDARQAGLVPEKEEHAKYIDITMREQHMRLFVFRGVPEDTYFEPKTRKEISKIQWYSIKDLPGFKKQKTHQEGEINANKFYMVAPFLGPLKKWINQQRKKDKTAATRPVSMGNGYAAAQMATEDEGDAEEYQTPEREEENDPRAQELKRLLSIGAPAAAMSSVAQPEQKEGHAGNLLAMLQASANESQKPHTPFEQINPFPQEPQTPHPDHLRHSQQQQQAAPPPQFPLSPQSMQQQEQQRHASMPTPAVFGPGQPAGFPHGPPPPGFPGMVPPHMQQQAFQQRQGMPGPMPGMPFGQQNGAPFNNQPRPPMPPPQMPPQMPPPHIQQQFQQPPPNSFAVQGPQGAIASGPTAPSASQLPPPRLNAQSMKLLNAFKTGSGQSAAPAAPAAGQAQRPASSHQNALLNLFRKPSTPQAQPTTTADTPVEAPASPTGTDVTVKPSKPTTKRSTTLNEITRTLPAKPKVKSPPPVEPVAQVPPPVLESQAAPAPPQPHVSAAQTLPERPKSRQLFDPNNPTPPTKTERQSTPTILQPPTSKQASRSPKPSTSGSSSAKGGQNGNQATPPFTILARPGSAKGGPPSSPLRTEATQKPPQVLKRPQTAETEEPKPADKKDQLLALFGKAPPASPTPPPPTQHEEHKATSGSEHKSALLDLFNRSTPTPTQAPSPPAAPRIEPERPTHPQQQNHHLLNLFTNTKATDATPTPTPISPFTLGTPVGGGGSRLGSEGGGSGNGTPTEAREFLMGYLNGVVRGAGSGSGSGKR